MSHLQVRRAPPAVVLALFLGIAGAACDVSVGDGGLSVSVASGKATDEWRRTYTIAPGGRLEIENDNGVVEASPADGTDDEVRAEWIVNATTDEAAQETVNGGIRLQLPPDAKANLEASCTNGGISLSDLPFQGEQSRHRVSGTVNGGGSRVVAGTVNGGIKISAGARSESD